MVHPRVFFTSSADTSVLKVKAEWTLTAERTPCVHTPGAQRAGVSLTFIHIWTQSEGTLFTININGSVAMATTVQCAHKKRPVFSTYLL